MFSLDLTSLLMAIVRLLSLTVARSGEPGICRIMIGQLALGDGHNEMMTWASIVPEVVSRPQVGPQMPQVGSKLELNLPKLVPNYTKIAKN